MLIKVIGWRDREPSRLPVRNLKRMWDELGKFAYERFVQVNTSPKSNKAPETRPEVYHCFVNPDGRRLVVQRTSLKKLLDSIFLPRPPQRMQARCTLCRGCLLILQASDISLLFSTYPRQEMAYSAVHRRREFFFNDN